MPEGPRKVLIVIAVIIALVAFVDGLGIWDIANFGMTSNPN